MNALEATTIYFHRAARLLNKLFRHILLREFEVLLLVLPQLYYVWLSFYVMIRFLIQFDCEITKDDGTFESFNEFLVQHDHLEV